jgi:ferritin-like metal-binding protein YciE
MNITSIGGKFIHDLSEVYDAELRFLEAQEQMHMLASSPQLKAALVKHRDQTIDQIRNLEQLFVTLGESPIRNNNPAAAGLVKSGEAAMEATRENAWYTDCAILTAVAQVEHYEIACYRNLIATAERIERRDVTSLLQQNLAQEEQTAQEAESGYFTALDDAVKMQQLASTETSTRIIG